MITITQLRELALSFPEANEQPHFEKTSFRIGKKIFATYNSKENRLCIKLSEIDQDVFSSFNSELVHPVPNKWGKQGWTLIYLEKVPEELVSDALITAYCEVAPRKLAILVRPEL